LANEFKRTIDDIEEALSNHVKTHKDPSAIVTGWVFVASVSEPDAMDRDGYIVQSSPALPHHVSVGLLKMALDDKRNFGIIATIQSMIPDDDED